MAQYRSEIAPEDADFLAQENQIGSGVLDEAAAPSTPFESDFNDDNINEVLPVPEAPRIVNELQQQDTAVITALQDDDSIAQQLKLLEPEDEQPVAEEVAPDELSLAIASLQAQLDLKRQAYARRPRKYTISSASTKKSHDALYLDNWRRRIEAVGNINYPDEARRLQTYGNVRMLVALQPTGRIDEVRILQSSGHTVLDQAALNIVNLAAPFEPFPDELRAEADILEVIRTFRFHEGNSLTSY
jgi:protein TonB